ncbi:MAG: tRNA1(Val) (adenine(37)-N6)-methyltransferase [Firmicutes bacterium ADurb.Bin182]|nr:MAG: tRNA1(Val) (adenine(37)-N6)-methyltransferase [Firmicutes bacterium ADurb.Bin182]
MLLASFVKAFPSDRGADLGCGTGVLSILVNGRTGARIEAVEIQEDEADRAERSVRLNGQTGITVHHADMRDFPSAFGYGKLDFTMCNPPYFLNGTVSPDTSRATSRHQSGIAIEDIPAACSSLLKNGGRAFFVYPASRLAEIFYALQSRSLTPKRLRLVLHHAGAAPKIALIECKKGAKHGMLFEPALIMHGDDGGYTEEMKEIYHIPAQPDR